MEHGVGTTCISLALSNFLCNKLGKKTAYIELNTTNQISCLNKKSDKKAFLYKGIHFFPLTTITSLSEIYRMNFDCYVLDMGILNAFTAEEFSKCDQQFLVCSLSEWKKTVTLEKIAEFIQKNYIHQEYVTVLGNIDIKKSKLAISSNIKCNYLMLPFLENPFQLVTRSFSFFYQIYERRIIIPR